LPTTNFIPADSIVRSPFPTSTLRPAPIITFTPEFIDSTAVPLPEGVELAAAPAFEQETEKYQLPPEQIPLSAQPNDHYYLTRPIDVTANSEYLFSYPYGSDGQGWRVHHGLDMPNRIGEPVLAANSGTVICADQTDEAAPELTCDRLAYTSYGKVIIVEHDFGWRGQPVYTLYAHLSEMLVLEGDHIEMGDVIGLTGATGFVTGPHVHFEVRVGANDYYSTRNPLLWMAPYIGHGVIAGRVIDENGDYFDNAQVQLELSGRIIDRTSTYINPYEVSKTFWNLVPDDNWKENFVLGDVAAGTYQLLVVVEDERFFQEVTVNAGITTFVEFRLNDVATPQAFDPQATSIIPTQGPTALPSATPVEP
ncbi:MAG TPA: M23 family metallopeptidase, partial [Aggregatilineales bacterium]|nr:M23 family metallopeptidase [Aggregatilineales bacterium]